MQPIAKLLLHDLALGRETTCDVEVAAVAIGDGRVAMAGAPEACFDQLVAGLERLADGYLRGHSQRAIAAKALAVYGRAAIEGDRQARLGRGSITSASQMLEVVRDVLGADAAERVRLAAAERMMGRVR